MFYKEEFTGHREGRKQEQKTRRHLPIHPHRQSEVIKGCVYSVTILISKEEITVLPLQRNKGEKAEALQILPSPHLVVGRGLLRQQGAAADFWEWKDTN